jgi:hypothetical protein
MSEMFNVAAASLIASNTTRSNMDERRRDVEHLRASTLPVFVILTMNYQEDTYF